MLNTKERRAEILAVLNVRRHDTMENLAFEFGVSRQTIFNDIQFLSISSPIYTICGKYGGGVYVMEGCEVGSKYLTAEQTELLNRTATTLGDDDQATMLAILKTFAVPEKGKSRRNYMNN